MPFKTVGIYGRQRSQHIADTLTALISFLKKQHVAIQIERNTAAELNNHDYDIVDYETLGRDCDLLIVVGGDGSLLHAARAAVKYETPVVGINRGSLGFLTDILPNELEKKLGDILAEKYVEEQRFLLTATVQHENQAIYQTDALNDVVLLPGKFAHMISFTIAVNDEMVYEQRADGLIISTPTGSTAYALSGGGPIIHPSLDAIVLVPMFPHTLSSRPIVLNSENAVVLHIHMENETSPYISCDGSERVAVKPGDRICVNKKQQKLRLIHPLDYNYFQTLRTKLGWQSSHLRKR